MKNKEQQEHFLQHGHLIGKKIQCNKCETAITMFGSNLENRIKKFGTLWSLLEEFKCRGCISASKPKKEKVISIRLLKRKAKEEKKNLGIPKLKPYVSREVSMKDSPALVSEMSMNGTCIRPDIYLDYGCFQCPYNKNCNASCNNWNPRHATA